MAFQLIIARGNSEGEQVVVVELAIRIGRDSDNGMVLTDAGVSRQHARIFNQQGMAWIEDLGSANGTLVNGERLDKPRALKTGDALAIGAALINFIEIEDVRFPVPLTGKAGALPPPPSTLTPSSREPMVPWETGEKPALFEGEPDVTDPLGKPQSVDPKVSHPPSKPALAPSPPVAEKPIVAPKSGLVSASVLKRSPDVSEQITVRGTPDAPPPTPRKPSAVAPVSDTKTPVVSAAPRDEFKLATDATAIDSEQTAVEQTELISMSPRVLDRALRQRVANETLGAQLAAGWHGLSSRTHLIITAMSVFFVTVVLLALFRLFNPDPVVALPGEPNWIFVSNEPIRHSFGLGDGVTYPRSDAKDFSFDFVSPTEAAVLVHYLAQDIDRGEVAVVVNGVDVGLVPADISVPDREIETLIPQRVLKRGEKNILTFDNVRNPPGLERWRIEGIWLELLPIPPFAEDEAIHRARQLAKHAGLLYAQRDIGRDNVFRAWKAYRESWQVLLGVAEDRRTTLFEQSQRKANELGQELDRQCGALMLDAKRQIESKDPERAKEILLEVGLYFPSDEHRCHVLANEKLDEYQL